MSTHVRSSISSQLIPISETYHGIINVNDIILPHIISLAQNHLGLDATKPVFGVSEKARLKPVSSATGTS